MKDRIWDIVGALTGIVFVVLLIISVGFTPGIRDDIYSITSTPAAEAANVLVDRSDQVKNR